MSNQKEKEIFSKNLKYYIEKRGKMPLDIANDLGFKTSTFYSWCAGTVYPRIDKIDIIANYLGIDKIDLINEHNPLKLDTDDEPIAYAIFKNKKKRELAYQIAMMNNIQVEKLIKMLDIINEN